MIRLCDNTNLIDDLSEKSTFAVRIKSLVKAYGLEYDFLQAWYQEKDFNVNSIIVKFYGAVVLYLTDNSNFKEILKFLEVVGYSSLLLDKKYSEHFGEINFKFGKIMKLSKNLTAPQNINIDKNAVFRKTYSLLIECSNENFAVPEFEPFYLDISHKIRHNAARNYAVFDNDKNKYTACALTSSETSENAIISAVAVSIGNRRQGYGGLIVKSICSDLQKLGKDVYIYRQENENIEFYKSLGFLDCGEWAEYTI